MDGKETYRAFCNLGIKQIKTIQEMPVEMMTKVFGKNGQTIWKKANGIDNTPVVQYTERKSISTERSFDQDTTDVKKLEGIIIAMTENLAFQLRRGNKLTACVSFKIRYSDFKTYTRQQKIPKLRPIKKLILLLLTCIPNYYQSGFWLRI